MDTAPLKSFATSARTELIREVRARITAVLAQGSPERVEQPRAVTALERAIAAGGGGDKGRAHVADKVAYTWFNRIIALRFMDANGYTGIGVVSPAADQVGQPEVLAAAKRGQVDGDVVKGANATIVPGLLNGTRQPRPGVDPQAEAYALLLADYCRYWNRAMPFMFEREGDYTELVIPANLLAEDSVLSRSVKVLTEDVCQDVEVIGWLYQFYISERKDEVFAGFKKNKKAGADEIPAATQLFTPHWIVRYLVENSLGRLWMLNHPESRLVDQMDYYIAPVDEETDFLKITKPEELTVIDPACGSGHMLTYAFDLLYAIYEEEGYAPSAIPGRILTNNLYGTEIDPRAGALAAFALTMKAAARRKLFLKNPVEPNICVLDPITFTPDELDYLVTKDGDRYAEQEFWNQFAEADTLGSLIKPDPAMTVRLARHLDTIDDDGDMLKADALGWARQAIRQAEFLLPRYGVLVANPPYMGSKNMGGHLSVRVATAFPEAKSDLFSAFVARSPGLLVRSGYAGFMTPNVWLYIASHKLLRSEVIFPRLRGLVELPLGGFRGATVQVCAFTMINADERSVPADFVRLVGSPGGEAEMASLTRDAVADAASEYRFKIAPRRFEAIPGSPAAYWFSDPLLQAFEGARTVSEIARAAKGLVTGDNAKYIRAWHEVSFARIGFGVPDRAAAKKSGRKWFPHAKGGDFRRWAGNVDAVVDWYDDGAALQTTLTDDGSRVRATNFNLDRIFKPGIVWTVVTSGAPSFRLVGPGHLFADASGVCQSDNNDYLLALFNSAAAAEVLNGINPTLNMQPGNVGAVPAPPDPASAEAAALAARAVDLSRRDWASRETAWEFSGLPLDRQAGTVAKAVGAAIDEGRRWVAELGQIETEVNLHFANLYGIKHEDFRPADSQVSLQANPAYRYAGQESSMHERLLRADQVRDLLSYAVGCMFGRYSLDEPGLILADQGATLQEYLAKVPTPAFAPDVDNVIPIVDGDWFEDDIVGRFRQFLRIAFGEQRFEENLRFVAETLGVKKLRDYFVKSFYKDHVQRYKKRPIYWLFSSPRGSFNALIYMHRYTPSTVSTVLTYLREYVTKLESALQQAERAGNAKEADRLRKILVELNEYEHDTLYPKASENVAIDLDDGVKANYPKFGVALKKVPGLEAVSD
ncbi:BREX-1 system adenine-specific DNA-methyltransferase PglX [Promicromonospora sp. Marseille-Q5078]